jgi:signal transduction histidine kinase
LAAREDFIGFTTHELKTPLTVILGFADVLSRRANELPSSTVAEVAELLLQEARRLEEIVENMLLLARSERGPADEPVLLHRIAETVLKNRHWRLPTRERQLLVVGTPGLVSAPTGWTDQVIENLVSNAEKYGDPESPIEVEIRDEGIAVSLTVRDRGRGITADEEKQLFEPFFRANPLEPGVPGIGLGLTVCRKLIGRLGGEIWLRPREGGGAEAGFRLPLADVGVDDL